VSSIPSITRKWLIKTIGSDIRPLVRVVGSSRALRERVRHRFVHRHRMAFVSGPLERVGTEGPLGVAFGIAKLARQFGQRSAAGIAPHPRRRANQPRGSLMAPF